MSTSFCSTTRAIVLCPILLILWGCAEQAPPVEESSIQRAQFALGVPQNGFPSWEERMLLVYINRARADPDGETNNWCRGLCAPYPVVKPMVYDYDLARAARFQSLSLLKAGAGWQPDAICDLATDIGSTFPDTCDGSPSCACKNGLAGCTCNYNADWLGMCMCFSLSSVGCPGGAARVQRFRPLFSALEHSGVVHSGGTKGTAYMYYVILFSSTQNPDRDKLLDGSYQEIGIGYATGATGCGERYWTLDYVTPDPATPVTIPLIPSGSHRPQTGPSGTEFEFRANYFHDSEGPQQAEVVIDGECHSLTLERGTQASGTWLLEQTLSTPDSLCAKYYYKFTDPAGAVVTYPSVGSLQVLVGSTTTCEDYTPQRATEGASCGGSTDAGLDLGSDAAPPGADLAGSVDLGGVDQQITSTDSSVTTKPEPPTLEDDGCSYAGRSTPRASSLPILLLLLLIPALGVVRGRRAR